MSKTTKYYIGARFGSWVIIEKAEPYYSPKGKRHNKVKVCCDCGEESIKHTNALGTGKSYACRNCVLKILRGKKQGVFHDLSEERFGRLTVTKKYHKRKKNTIWTCKCDCGITKDILATSLVGGLTKSCGCLKKRGGPTRYNWGGIGELSGTQFGNIRRGAKSRNLEFLITKEYIYDLYIKQNKKCLISGLKISLEINTASLDRIDSSKGYIKDNVQWLHTDINRMKWDLEQKEFIRLCKKIAKNN